MRSYFWIRAALYTVRGFLVASVLITVSIGVGLVPGSPMSISVGPLHADGSKVSVAVAGGYDVIKLCPDKPLEVRSTKQGTAYRLVPADCATAKQVRLRYGPQAHVVDPLSIEITATDLSKSERLEFKALLWIGALALWGGVIALERMLAAASRSAPFAARNVLWMRVMAGSAALGWLGLPLLARPVTSAFVRHHGPDFKTTVGRMYGFRDFHPAWTDNLLWWLVPATAVCVLLAFAAIWRSGVELREDVEATV